MYVHFQCSIAVAMLEPCRPQRVKSFEHVKCAREKPGESVCIIALTRQDIQRKLAHFILMTIILKQSNVTTYVISK